MKLRLLALLAAFVISSCSAPGAGTSLAPPQSSLVPAAPPRALGARRGTLRLSFRIPRRRHRRSRYISAATQSFVVSAQSGTALTSTFVNVTPSSPSCSQGLLKLTCSVELTLVAGSYTVTISAYDAQQSSATGTPAGNLLSANSVAATVVSGRANTVNATLDAVAKTITVTPSSGQSNAAGNDASGLRVLGGAAVTLLVAAYDADGYVIVGPGAPAMTLTAQNASGGIAVTPATNGNPNAFALRSTSVGSATLVASATPAQGSVVTANVAVAAVVTTSFVAGQVGNAGLSYGTGAGAQFPAQAAFTYDPDNGNLYAADTADCVVLAVTPAGTVSHVAGTVASCDASGNDLFAPQGIAYDHDDGYLYISDTRNCTIDRVTPAGANFSRIAGTAGTCNSTGSDFNAPWGVVYGGNQTLFVADENNCEIRAIFNLDGAPSTSTLSGGPGDCATVGDPRALAFDGSSLYFTSALHCNISRVGTFGDVTVLAGMTACLQFLDGTGTAAGFGLIANMAYDSSDGALYVSDLDDDAIRRVTTAGVVTTLFGNPSANTYQEGTLTTPALTNQPSGITYATGTPGALYFNDSSGVVRVVDL